MTGVSCLFLLEEVYSWRWDSKKKHPKESVVADKILIVTSMLSEDGPWLFTR